MADLRNSWEVKTVGMANLTREIRVWRSLLGYLKRGSVCDGTIMTSKRQTIERLRRSRHGRDDLKDW